METILNLAKKELKKLIDIVCSDSDKGVRTIEKFVNDIITKIHFLYTHQCESGKLPFKVSFSVSDKISFPYEINSDIVSSLVKNPKRSSAPMFMYM